MCIARTLEFLDDDDSHQDEMTKHLMHAQQLGSAEAAYLLWKQRYGHMVSDIIQLATRKSGNRV